MMAAAREVVMSHAPIDAPDNSGVRIFPPGIYLACLLVGFAVQWVRPAPIGLGDWPQGLKLVGGVVILLGLGLMGSALVAFRKAGTAVNPTRPTSAITRDGPYRLTRNPMYLGFALVHGGIALWADALWPLLTLPLAMWMVQVAVIDKEERYLAEKFGDDYLSYKVAVRRWI